MTLNIRSGREITSHLPLTPAQAAAVADDHHEILALACAGSGKSRTLAHRVARLTGEGEAPSAIVAFTFTNKAAESLKRRITEALQATHQDPLLIGAMFVGTIDSFTKLTLGNIDARYRQFEQLDPNRTLLYLMSRYPQLGIPQFKTNRKLKYFRAIEAIAEAWETIQNIGADRQKLWRLDPELANIMDRVQTALERDQYLDFASACRLVAEAFENQRRPGGLPVVSHLLVDEYQDINPLQQRLIDALHSRGADIFVVGDDDQAIFGWRGADISNILTFQEKYSNATVHRLVENFRSTEPIVSIAEKFISAELGPNRMPKTPSAATNISPQDLGVFMFDSQHDEAAFVAQRIADLIGTQWLETDGTRRGLAPGDFAILMKSTRLGAWGATDANHRVYTDALAAVNVPFAVESTGDLFRRPHVAMLRDAMTLLRDRMPDRDVVTSFFEERVATLFRRANRQAVFDVYEKWGRLVHTPVGGARRRVFPQQLLLDLLNAFRVYETDQPTEVMHDLGTFSRILQDVEAVYPSVDSAERYGDVLNFLSNPADGRYEVSPDDASTRPDAVFVSTIHKAKGLEFPVVFIVDARGTQYPGNRSGYTGVIPSELIAAATARGAYVHGPAQSARLFYTAITRAERYLYVSAARQIPRNVRPAKLSSFALRLLVDGVNQDPARVPAAPPAEASRRAAHEKDLPTSFSDLKYYLRCPKDYEYRKVFGFSPPISEMFGFGLTVHTTIGKIHERFPSQSPSADEAAAVANETFHLKHVFPSRDPENRPGGYERAKDAAQKIARDYVENHPGDFSSSKQVEVRFEIPVAGAVMTGSIDLLVKNDSEMGTVAAEVIDFKAIEGTEDPLENAKLDWRDLSLQVQLYARAANDVLGQNTRAGSVHLLKDNQRIAVPIDPGAIEAAVQNVEWAVKNIVAHDFPRRPSAAKCGACDFRLLCSKRAEAFASEEFPPGLHLPNGKIEHAAAFSDFER